MLELNNNATTVKVAVFSSSENQRHFLQTMLEKNGLNVVVSEASGDQFVSALKKKPADVLLIDMRDDEDDDLDFLDKLKQLRCIAIDMETATIFIVGHHNQIARGALLLVSDVPVTPEGIKTEESDINVTRKWGDIHLQLGIEAMSEIGSKGEKIKHFKY